jgi:glycerol-3-phosphate cytidylyltransferase-like family protein
MTETLNQYDVGVIHGRFQVLHNDHLKYLLLGKALFKHLVVWKIKQWLRSMRSLQ